MAEEEQLDCPHNVCNVQAPFQVLICVDDSQHSWHAVQYYADHLHRRENRILLVRIIELPESTRSRSSSMSPATLIATWKDEEAKAHLHIAKVVELLKTSWVLNVRSRVERGLKPGELIVRLALEVGADLIICGTRGKSTIRRTVFGSVSDYIMHHSNVAVTVVHLPHVPPNKHSNIAQPDKSS